MKKLLIFGVLAFIPNFAFAATTVIYLTNTSASSWSVPSDWNNSNNSIEVIGGGGSGGDGSNGTGGGGGAYAKKTNVSLSGTVSFHIGSGGTSYGSGGDTYFCNSSSNCGSIAGSAVVVGAKGGSGGNSGGTGGQASNSVGSTKYSGGNGGAAYNDGSGEGASGGGGAAGPFGAGASGGSNSGAGRTLNGQGGGGAGGGTVGTSNGGDNHLGSGGGIAGSFATCNAGAGSNGGGGGGSGFAACGGANGGNGTDWDINHGSGGGGGGGSENDTGAGGAGGLYGGGGGGKGAEESGSQTNGAQGIIVITYSPAGGSLGGSAGTPGVGEISGWGWNGSDDSGTSKFGLISFNSKDSCDSALCTGGTSGGGPYAVSIDSSGNWSGYAWSEYLGWISFNSADVTAHCGGVGIGAAHLDTSTGAVTGGAYALIYTDANATSNAADGCIELSHAGSHPSPGSGVTYDTTTHIISGYAWGGDPTTKTGPGWIQFNNLTVAPSSITGACFASSPYRNAPPNTNVTFTAQGTSGTAPYTYSWNGGSFAGTATFGPISYPSSNTGPQVNIKDANGITTGSFACPAVTILPPVGTGNILLGKTVATANATSYSVKQNGPFVVKWNLKVTSDYTCVPSLSPNPGNANWTNNWVNLSWSSVDNGDGTVSYTGNTTDSPAPGSLTAGTNSNPISPGIYTFGAVCTSDTNPTQTAGGTIKINLSSEHEI